MNQNYSNHITNMAVQGSYLFVFFLVFLFIISTSFSKIQFTILMMFSLLVSVNSLRYFPYIFIQVQAF